MANIKIDYKSCEGVKCGVCAYACPTNVFTIKKDEISINTPDSCKLCNRCMEVCPKAAITIKRTEIIFEDIISEQNRHAAL